MHLLTPEEDEKKNEKEGRMETAIRVTAVFISVRTIFASVMRGFVNDNEDM